MGRLPWSFHQGSYLWNPVDRSTSPNDDLHGDDGWAGTQVPQTNQHSEGTWLQLPIHGSWHNRCRQLGTPQWLCQHMDSHAVSLDICLAVDIHSPKLRDCDLLSGVDVTLDIIQAKLLMCSGARACRMGAPLARAPSPLHNGRATGVTQTCHTEVDLPSSLHCPG